MVSRLQIHTRGQGLHEITEQVRTVAARATTIDRDGGRSPLREGLCTVFIRHTSASLVIQENADPTARHDLEQWLNRLVPEDQPEGVFTHRSEGPDDMPSHIKSALTASSLSIPIIDGKLGLGRWQGIYLWEHRREAHTREVLVHVGE